MNSKLSFFYLFLLIFSVFAQKIVHPAPDFDAPKKLPNTGSNPNELLTALEHMTDPPFLEKYIPEIKAEPIPGFPTPEEIAAKKESDDKLKSLKSKIEMIKSQKEWLDLSNGALSRMKSKLANEKSILDENKITVDRLEKEFQLSQAHRKRHELQGILKTIRRNLEGVRSEIRDKPIGVQNGTVKTEFGAWLPKLKELETKLNSVESRFTGSKAGTVNPFIEH